jgi:hypothetical protein
MILFLHSLIIISVALHSLTWGQSVALQSSTKVQQKNGLTK